MPLRKICLKINENDAGKRLDQVLSDSLSAKLAYRVSKARVRLLLVAGAVYLNRKRVRIASKPCRAGASVDVYLDEEKWNELKEKTEKKVVLEETHILFEDEYLIAMNKPAGIPTQPTLDEARQNVFSALRSYLAQRDGLQEQDVYLALHHRLDRDTSGVLILAKKKEINAGLADLFSDRKVKKTYEALVSFDSSIELPKKWKVKNFLSKSSQRGKKAKIHSVRSGGNPAYTEFERLELFKCGAWIRAFPHTGRMHQIRVHLSEQGYPILGDTLYGGLKRIRNQSVSRGMLHAKSLEFTHPKTQKKIQIESPLPQDFESLKYILSQR